MNIVTGYTGTPHVTANEAQALNQGIFGPSNYVLDVGEKFSATLVDANNITIEDGEGVLQGVQFRIAPGETENVSIDSGTTGYNRIDLICARYTKDAQTGVEAVNLVVIKGTPTSSTPSEPAYNEGDVLLNDSPVDFPLYRVTLTGLTPVITKVFTEAKIVNSTMPPVLIAKRLDGVMGGTITQNPEQADYSINYDFENNAEYIVFVVHGYSVTPHDIPASVNLSLLILEDGKPISKTSNDGTNTYRELTTCALILTPASGTIPTYKVRTILSSASAIGQDTNEYLSIRILKLAK